MYVNATGKKADEIDKAIDRDCWFSAQEALKFGLINGIITSFKELK
jgi:ATP-dependent Clp protease protease subunit